MRKKVGIIKRVLCIGLVFLLSINSFAAIVSDNDGSAFITKAEFDALKSSFQSQIDNYNQSIDSKIDGAIASYLAGIQLAKTVTNTWEVGGGEECLVFNSDTVNDLSWGKAQIEINAADAYIWTANDGPDGYFMLKMERGAAASDYGYEVFDVLNNTTFNNYCSAAKLKVAINTVGHGSGGGASHTSIPSTTYFYMRWHGQPFYTLPTLHRGETSFTDTAYYSDRICDCQFLTMYASGINAGFWKIANVSHTATASWEKKVDKTVKWVFDAGIAQNQLWSYDLSQKTGLEQVVASTQPRYAAATSLHPQTYTTPGDAGISSTFSGYFSGKASSNSYRWSLSHLQWYTKGEYNNTTTTGTSREWYELQLENKKYYSKNLKNNNFSAATLASYAPFGFTGAITEGMPIGIFKKVCLVEFDLDTTSLGQDAIIAFDTAPMVITSTQRLDDWPVNSNFDLVVDGITKPTSAAKISAGLHHIKLNIKNDTEKMILFKVSFPKTVTSSVRKIFRLPTEYAVTSMD